MSRRPSVEKLYTNDNWIVRRRILFALIMWKVVNVQYLAIWGADSTLNQNLVLAMVAAIVAETGTYVFGAVADDKNKRDNLPPPVIDNERGRAPPEGFGE